VRSEARVVVIGGGVAGCSLLYHLTKLGWTDVVLVEANELTSGSTWHAAGLCTQFIASYNLMGLLKYSLDLYQSLEAETGQAVDFHEVGSLRLAMTQDRLDEFHHRQGIAEAVGVPFDIVSRERAQELYPLADLHDVGGERERVIGVGRRASEGRRDAARDRLGGLGRDADLDLRVLALALDEQRALHHHPEEHADPISSKLSR